MTECVAIHAYIADKWMPELLGRDHNERAQVNMLANVLNDFKGKVTFPCYSSADKGPIK